MFTDPFAPMVSLRQAMDQLLNDSFVGNAGRSLWSRSDSGTAAFPVPIDVYATPDEVVVLAAAPGLEPDQLHVNYQQGTLVLSGTIRDVAQSGEAKHATWYAHELWNGSFQRALTLPFPIDADRARASVDNGIIKIVLPKAEQAKPKTISVNAGQQSEAIGAGR